MNKEQKIIELKDKLTSILNSGFEILGYGFDSGVYTDTERYEIKISDTKSATLWFTSKGDENVGM